MPNPTLKIMTWNTRGDIDDELLANLINENDVDILALQELPQNRDMSNLFTLIDSTTYSLQHIDHAFPQPFF